MSSYLFYSTFQLQRSVSTSTKTAGKMCLLQLCAPLISLAGEKSGFYLWKRFKLCNTGLGVTGFRANCGATGNVQSKQLTLKAKESRHGHKIEPGQLLHASQLFLMSFQHVSGTILLLSVSHSQGILHLWLKHNRFCMSTYIYCIINQRACVCADKNNYNNRVTS